MPDVLKADDLDLSGDQRARTSHLPPQHGAPLPAVDPAATPDELRPHSVWLTELLHAFVEQRRLAREAAPAEPQGAGKGARLPAATDREGWEAAKKNILVNVFRKLVPIHIVQRDLGASLKAFPYGIYFTNWVQ